MASVTPPMVKLAMGGKEKRKKCSTSFLVFGCPKEEAALSFCQARFYIAKGTPARIGNHVDPRPT